MLYPASQNPNNPPETHPQLGQLICTFSYSMQSARSKLILGIVLAIATAGFLLAGTEMLKPIGAICGILALAGIGIGISGKIQARTVTSVFEHGVRAVRDDKETLFLFDSVIRAQIDYVAKQTAVFITIKLASHHDEISFRDRYMRVREAAMEPIFDHLINHVAYSIPADVKITGRHNIDRDAVN
jgi:hypothetical protein